MEKVIDVEATEAPTYANAVAKRSNGAAVKRQKSKSVATGADALLAIIERVACDPSADLAKMRELLELRQSIEDKAASREYAAAMMATQSEMEPIRADARNEQTKSRYATYPALDASARPIYTRHGFALTFDTEPAKNDSEVRVICDVMHAGGHTRRYGVDMPADGKGAKGGEVMTRTHATGAAISYGQRYLVLMIFNIAVDKDKDGNAASAPKPSSGPITEKQYEQLRQLMDEVGADMRRFCEHFKIPGVAQLPAAQFQRAIDALNTKRARQ